MIKVDVADIGQNYRVLVASRVNDMVNYCLILGLGVVIRELKFRDKLCLLVLEVYFVDQHFSELGEALDNEC